MFNSDIFKGTNEQYNEKLRILSLMAEPEKWTFSKVEAKDPFRILKNYIVFTYDRLEEENKLLITEDGQNMCMNTGLLTEFHQEIVGLFSKYVGKYDCKWYLIGFFKATDGRITEHFHKIPMIADYTKNAAELVYDRHLEIVIQKEHIINDNYERFQNVGYNDKTLINALLDDAINTMKLKLERNYKLALPFLYHNTETGENKIQLLAPLYMAGAPVRLAVVLDRRTNSTDNEHYEAITVIPVDWAYMNSRVIVRPEEEWAKIVDEAESDEKIDIKD